MWIEIRNSILDESINYLVLDKKFQKEYNTESMFRYISYGDYIIYYESIYYKVKHKNKDMYFICG